ncbi:MAG: glycosyltransferase family 4 protein [Planctomycetes bacterium]|nr:glycosyltransferase family 4 protein [Planctomycetota bacterium]MCH8964427.1 glycosyltransferase family 4 protein [Planctomycetota bacterium]
MAVTIGLDARSIYAKTRRGTGKNLLDAYRVMARLRPEWRFVLYHRGFEGVDPFAEYANVSNSVIDIRGDRWNLWEHLRLPAAASDDGIDLLHCPANSCPRFRATRVVSTVHDLIPLKLSDPAMNGEAQRFRNSVRRCLARSERVIAVSESTKQDLVSDLDGDPDQIDVITWAADSACVPVRDEAELARIRSRYNITSRYMLAFSGRSRRKNAEGMIRGFARLPADLRREVRFVLVGVEPNEQRTALAELIGELRIAENCAVFGFAPEEDIAPLLSGAEALAFCSLYEGFGLPILDAFRCETAVLTSNVSSMPEVAGEAAVYCDPGDCSSIADGMTRLLRDRDLRDLLVERGRKRVRQFTWEGTAETICGIFEKCL